MTTDTRRERGTVVALRSLGLLYAPPVIVLGGVAAAYAVLGVEPSRFLLDPAVLSDSHPLLGAVSNLGVAIWAATVTVCLFTAGVLRTSSAGNERAFLLSAGVVSAGLMVDDLFMLHEWFFPEVLGFPQTLVLVTYAGVVAAVLVAQRHVVLGSDRRLLLLAGTFFAASVATDQLPGHWAPAWQWLYLIEDGFKLLGIVSWFGYFVGLAASSLAVRPRPTRRTPTFHAVASD